MYQSLPAPGSYSLEKLHPPLVPPRKEPSNLPPGGIAPPEIKFNVKKALIPPEEGPVPEIQERLWRQNVLPGDKDIFWALKGHKMPPPYHTYGIEPPAASLTVFPSKTTFAEVIDNEKDAKYQSVQQMPLGHSPSLHYKWPGNTGSPDFVFGMPTKGSERAKDLIHLPPGSQDIPNEMHEQYIKTHGDYNPGEQVSRHYNWQGDGEPAKYDRSFGMSTIPYSLLDGQQAKELVQPEPQTTQENSTHVVSSYVDEYNHWNHNPLGGVLPLKARDIKKDDDFVYGQPPNPDPDSVKTLYPHPYMGPDAWKPDEDIGRSMALGRFGNRTVRDCSGDESMRPAGVPSIRTDIPWHRVYSVTDQQNYGDEAGLKTLIHPLPWVELGLSENDFKNPISREKLHSLVMIPTNPFNLSEDEFQMLCNVAESGSLLTIQPDRNQARINNQAFNSTDKAARMLKVVDDRGDNYLSVFAFNEAFMAYELHRIEQQMMAEQMETTQLNMSQQQQRIMEREVPVRRKIINQYGKDAIIIGVEKSITPLNMGKK